MPIISNRSYHNREPRQAYRSDRRNYTFGNCSKCGSPYAIPEGTQWNDDNCWTCNWLRLRNVTEREADKLHSHIEVCLTDETHKRTATPEQIAQAQEIARDTEWLGTPECQHDDGRSVDGNMLKCFECGKLFAPRNFTEIGQVVQFSGRSKFRQYDKYEPEL